MHGTEIISLLWAVLYLGEGEFTYSKSLRLLGAVVAVCKVSSAPKHACMHTDTHTHKHGTRPQITKGRRCGRDWWRRSLLSILEEAGRRICDRHELSVVQHPDTETVPSNNRKTDIQTDTQDSYLSDTSTC